MTPRNLDRTHVLFVVIKWRWGQWLDTIVPTVVIIDDMTLCVKV